MGAAAIPLLAIGTSAVSISEQRRARRQAEEQAAKERERLAAIEAKDPPALPTDDTVRKARRRSIKDLAGRRGRASTILTDSGGQALGA